MAKKTKYLGMRISPESLDGLNRIASLLGDGCERKGKKMLFELFETIEGNDENDFVQMVFRNGISRNKDNNKQ